MARHTGCSYLGGRNPWLRSPKRRWSPRPLDYLRYADRLKDYGAAIKAGEPVTVTKIKVKSRLIEFQLGGGGYGTFGDETSGNVMAALAQYVDFGQLRANESEPAAKPQARTGSLHKGMLLQDVEAQLGPPTATTERKENLKMVRRVGMKS